MTLLLAANCDHGIVMMSDGLCRQLSPSGAATVLALDQQKIFPLAGRPVAVAHHGQNRLKGEPVERIVADLEKNFGDLASIREIAEGFQRSLDPMVRETLRNLGAQGVMDGCGFWIAGYGQNDELPSLCEIFWTPGGNDVEFTEKEILIEGGDGKRFAQSVRQKHPSFDFAEDARGWSLGRWSEYIERLYKVAAREPGAKDVFGGKVWKLWVEKSGCKWMVK